MTAWCPNHHPVDWPRQDVCPICRERVKPRTCIDLDATDLDRICIYCGGNYLGYSLCCPRGRRRKKADDGR